MDTLTADGTGSASKDIVITPGKRYALKWVRAGNLSAGNLVPREFFGDKNVNVGFMDKLSGGSPLTWDLASDAIGGFEFPATSNVFRLSLTGGTANGDLHYSIKEIIE